MIKSAFRDFIFVMVVAVLLGAALGLFCAPSPLLRKLM